GDFGDTGMRPDVLSGLGVQRLNPAVDGDGEDPPVGDGRRRSDRCRQGTGPDGFAVAGIQSNDLAVAGGREDPVAADGDAAAEAAFAVIGRQVAAPNGPPV